MFDPLLLQAGQEQQRPDALVAVGERMVLSPILPVRRVNLRLVPDAPFAVEGRVSAVSGAAVGRPAAVFPHRHEGDGTKTAAMAMLGNTAQTFLVHIFGTGLADGRQVIHQFRARADGDIVPGAGAVTCRKDYGQARRNPQLAFGWTDG